MRYLAGVVAAGIGATLGLVAPEGSSKAYANSFEIIDQPVEETQEDVGDKGTDPDTFSHTVQLESFPAEQTLQDSNSSSPAGTSEYSKEIYEASSREVMKGDSSRPALPQTRIVGGVDREINWAPWQVALVSKNSGSNFEGQFCGGSIISTYWIVTAAHCLEDRTKSQILDDVRILAGDDYLGDDLSNTSVNDVIIHPKYNAETTENDIALLKLSEPLTLGTANLAKIDLPSKSPLSGSTGRISGWGNTWMFNGSSFLDYYDTGAPYPRQLQGGEVSVRTSRDCQLEMGKNYFKSKSMICANSPGYWIDVCFGDSGGPLATFSNGGWVLSGITSWGWGCAWDSPTAYTNVAKYTKWITANALIPSEPPGTSSPSPTRTGFTATVTNYSPVYKYSARVIAGKGKVNIRGASITVTKMSPGTSATVLVSVKRKGYTPASSTFIGEASPG